MCQAGSNSETESDRFHVVSFMLLLPFFEWSQLKGNNRVVLAKIKETGITVLLEPLMFDFRPPISAK